MGVPSLYSFLSESKKKVSPSLGHPLTGSGRELEGPRTRLASTSTTLARSPISHCPRPAPTPPAPALSAGSCAPSCFFVLLWLVCRAVLTKAAVWPGVGGGSAAGGQDPALQFPGSAGRRQGVGLGAGLPGWGPGSPSRKHALEESNLRLWGHHADRPCGVPGRPQEESQALAKQWALLPHVPVWPCPAVHTPCPDTARAGLSQHVHSLESKGGGLRAVQPSVPG